MPHASSTLVAQTSEIESTGHQIVARVGETTIKRAAVDRELNRILGDRSFSDSQRRRLWQVTRDQMIDRRVVYLFLQQAELGAGDSEIQMQQDALEADLAVRETTLENYLQERLLSRDELMFQLAWQVAWPRYLDKMLTDENLAKHYQNNQRRFDGTELEVAHLLLKTDKSNEAATMTKAAEIASELNQGKTNWSDAVTTHSDASQESAGRMGWIHYDRPMPPAFNEVAFKLNKGEISSPVKTAFGIHLIKCLDIRPGKRGWQDARRAVAEDAKRFLFRRIADKHRDQIEITRTPIDQIFDPSTNDTKPDLQRDHSTDDK